MEISRPFLESIAEEHDFNNFGIATIERYGDSRIDRGEEIIVKSSDERDCTIEQRITSKDAWHRFLKPFKR